MDHRTIVSFFTCQLVWVNRYIGGAQIYQHYLQSGLVDELVITFVDACVASKGGGKVHFFPANFFLVSFLASLKASLKGTKEMSIHSR